MGSDEGLQEAARTDREALKELAKPYEEKIKEERKAKLDAEAREALDIRRTSGRRNSSALAKNAEAQIKPEWDEVVADHAART